MQARAQGQVDIDVEILKSRKKLDLARMNLEKVRKVESQSGYADTVPEDVRLVNEDKVRRRLVPIFVGWIRF